MRKIVTVHGIRTENTWPLTLKKLVGNRPNVEVINFDYGYFTLFQFLSRRHRERAIKSFQNFYAENFTDGVIPSIVCHSFGTFIFFSSIRKHKEIKFDTVILCGSILSSKLNWKPFFDSGQIRMLYNDYGERDKVVRLSKLVIRKCGRSGQIGFKKIQPEIESKVIQRRNYFEHSDYFYQLHIKDNWLKILVPEHKTVKYDKRILRPEVVQRVYQNMIEPPIVNLERIEFHARIDESGNYFARYIKQCTNVSGSDLDMYNYKTSADSIEDADDMGFTAYDSEGMLLYCYVENDLLQHKTCVIRLNNPVHSGDRFSLTYFFKWKNTMTFKRGDTDHFEIRNSKQVYIALNFKQTLVNPRFLVISDYEVIEELNVKRKNEADSTVSYYVDYNNENNYDGLVFYFEGANFSKHPPMSKEIKGLKNPVSGIQLYTCSISDIKQVYKLEADIEYSNAASEGTLIERQSMFSDGFIVAKDKNKVVGYIETVIWNKFEFEKFDDIKNFPQFYQPTGNTLYVIFLGVDVVYRKRGIAQALLESVEKLATKYSFNRIQLVAKENLVDYYSNFGFSILKELPDFLPDRSYKSTLMEKIIIKSPKGVVHSNSEALIGAN